MRGVRMLQSTVRIPASVRTVSNAVVKFEPQSRIMNLTRCAARRGPSPGCELAGRSILQCDSENADAPGGVLYHRQDIGLGAVEQAGGEEVARQDRLGLGTQEPRPGRSGSAWRRVDSGLLRISHTVEAAIFTPRPADSPGSAGIPIRGSRGPAGGPGS